MRMRLTLSIAWQAISSCSTLASSVVGAVGDYILSVSVWENRDGSLDSDEGVHGH